MEKKRIVPNDPNLSTEEKAAAEAVREYEIAVKVLDMFKIDHSKIFTEYNSLEEDVEQKRQVADKLVRSTGKSCGPWEAFTEQKTYNAQELYNLMGEEKFLALGGVLREETIYDVDKSKIDIAISQKLIPKEVAEVIRKITPKYRAPK